MGKASRDVEGETGLQRIEEGKNRPAHRLHRTLKKGLLLTRGYEEDEHKQVEVGEEKDVHVLGRRTKGKLLRARVTRQRR